MRLRLGGTAAEHEHPRECGVDHAGEGDREAGGAVPEALLQQITFEKCDLDALRKDDIYEISFKHLAEDQSDTVAVNGIVNPDTLHVDLSVTVSDKVQQSEIDFLLDLINVPESFASGGLSADMAIQGYINQPESIHPSGIIKLDDWTIDLWVKHDDHAGVEYYMQQYEDDNNRWYFVHVHGTGIGFGGVSGGTGRWECMWGGEITDTDWHHVALCKVADKFGVYKDGNQVCYVQDSNTDTFNGTLYVGQNGNSDYYFDGNIRLMESLQYSKRVFSAGYCIAYWSCQTIQY